MRGSLPAASKNVVPLLITPRQGLHGAQQRRTLAQEAIAADFRRTPGETPHLQSSKDALKRLGMSP
jgi:hypothetical protein